MTIVFNGSLASDNFADYLQLQANGTAAAGSGLATGISGRIELAADPVGSERVGKFTLNDSDALTASGRRSEYACADQAIGSEFWYYWRYYLPADFECNVGRWVIAQVHDTPDGPDAAHAPPLSFYIGTDEVLYVENVYDANATTTSNSYTRRDLTSWAIERNAWVSLVMRITWSATAGSGALTLWKDRRKIFSESAHINTFNDTTGPYFKAGIYDYQGTGGFGTQTVYQQGVIIGDNAYSTFDSFMSAAGSSDTELEGFIVSGIGL